MYFLGLHKEHAHIKVALLCKVKNKIEIALLQSFPLDVKPLDILKTVLAGKKVKIVSGLETNEVIRRDISLKLAKEKEIRSVLPFQVESLIPFPLAETILLPVLYPRNKHVTDVTIFATKKDLLLHHLADLKNSDINPDTVSTTAVALSRWGKLLFPHTKEFSVLQGKTCIVYSEGKIVAAHAIEDNEKGLEQVQAFVKTKFPNAFLVWEESVLAEMQETPSYSNFEFQSLKEFAIPIGLALDGLIDDSNSLQFLQGDLTSQKEAQSQKMLILKYVAACICLAVGLWSFGSYRLNAEQLQLEQIIVQHIGKEGAKGCLQDQIESWEDLIEKQERTFPLSPNIYLVSDVLAWLSSRKENIDIRHIHYDLVKCPTLEEKNIPYLVKVDLELTAPSESAAKDFYETLKKQTPFINTSKEISWSCSHDVYKTSFYLKQKL
ncbi:MAG: hypothetical protein LVR00_08155 [Rhabdochlamydiaceae bacterium]|jgi:hypothetical protein